MVWVWALLALAPLDQQVSLEGFREVYLTAKIGAFRVQFLPTDGSMLTLRGTYWPEIVDTPQIEVEPGEEEGVLHITLALGTKEKRSLKWPSGFLDSNQVRIELPRDGVYRLDLEMGAVDAEIELGGVPVKTLDFKGGAARTALRFQDPNPWRGGTCTLEVGAAKLVVEQLGNGNFTQIKIAGGIAAQDLDLHGTWRVPAALQITGGMSKLEIKVPQDLGVRVSYKGVLTYSNWERFQKVGSHYQTMNYEEASKRLEILLEGALNMIDFDFVE